MRQNTILCGLGGLCVLLLTVGLIAQNAPGAKRTLSQTPPQASTPARKPPMAAAHVADASAAEAQAALVKQVLRRLPQRKRQSGRTLARRRSMPAQAAISTPKSPKR